MTNPFAESEPTTDKGEGENMESVPAMPVETVSRSVVSTSSYPYIDKAGDIKIGLAVTLEDSVEDALFGDSDDKEKMMVIFDAESQKAIMTEQAFTRDNLSKKMKVITEEVFVNLSNVRKKVSLMKAHKNLINNACPTPSYMEIHEDELKIVAREMKKNATLSKDLISKIAEATGDDLEGMLTAYQFKKHLLITGDAGQGKTFIVDKFIDDGGFTYVQENGHTGLEAIDLIGHMIKLPDGNFGWKDGSLSEAFRLAEAGERVVYFIDEVLRIPARELNILVSSLTPNSRGQLKLRTNRPAGTPVDGIVKGEEITIAQENFWVVATTNQGSGYQSSRIDEALKDRFRLYYQEMPADDVGVIVALKYARLKGTAVAVKSIISLIDKTKEIQSTGNIPRSFTIRHLSEAIDTATSLKDVKKKMVELANNIVAIDADGRFNSSQVQIVTALIKKTM